MLISPGARRVAGTGLALAVLAACAKIEPPPGAPPDATPPSLVATNPDTLGVYPGFSGDVSFVFSEVIAEGNAPSQGFGTSDLERLIILSPTTRPPVVRWHRNRITVHPREGWQPDRVYRVQLLPGVTDLRNNRSTAAAAVVTFTTGAPRPTRTLSGAVYDWAAGRPGVGALIEARHAGDSLTYRMIADSSGRFSLGPLPAGEYLVSGTLDQNRNLQRDPRDTFDSVRLGPDRDTTGTLYAFPHDTVGPRLQSAFVGDSMTATLTFSQPLDPAQQVEPAAVTVRLLPDSTPLPVRSALPPRIDDSLHARVPADTARRAPIDTAAAQRAKGPLTAPERPALSDHLVLRVGAPFRPGGHYVITVHGLRNVAGVAADATGALSVAEPPPPPPPVTDSTGADSSRRSRPGARAPRRPR